MFSSTVQYRRPIFLASLQLPCAGVKARRNPLYKPNHRGLTLDPYYCTSTLAKHDLTLAPQGWKEPCVWLCFRRSHLLESLRRKRLTFGFLKWPNQTGLVSLAASEKSYWSISRRFEWTHINILYCTALANCTLLVLVQYFSIRPSLLRGAQYLRDSLLYTLYYTILFVMLHRRICLLKHVTQRLIPL